jgi:hypothetical protein
MRQQVDLSQVDLTGTMEDGIYTATIKHMERKPAKSGNPMRTLTWAISDGPNLGREIRYDNLVLSGINQKGDPIQPIRLAQLLVACKIPFTCEECAGGPGIQDDRIHTITIGDGTNGKKRGHVYCENGHELHIDFEDDAILGASCRVEVATETNDKGRSFNVIKRYLSLD